MKETTTMRGAARRANTTSRLSARALAVLETTIAASTTAEVADTIGRIDQQLAQLRSVPHGQRTPRGKRVRYLVQVRAVLVSDLARRTGKAGA